MSALTARPSPTYSPRQTAGFVLGAVVALTNIPFAFIPTSGEEGSEQAGPPPEVLAVCLVLGLVTVALLLWGWRTGRRGPVRAAAVLLTLAALLAVPAFFVVGVPAWGRLVVGLFVLATIAAIVLLFSPGPRQERPGS